MEEINGSFEWYVLWNNSELQVSMFSASLGSCDNHRADLQLK